MPRHHDDRQRHPQPDFERRTPDQRHRFALALIILTVAGLAFVQVVDSTVQPVHEDPSAVLIDQLSLTIPNATFVTQSTSLLEASGYIVDYVPGEQVTTDFYKHLPSMGYDIIIIRTHSTSSSSSNPSDTDLVLFTNEIYDPHKHQYEQAIGRLAEVGYTTDPEEDPTYVAVRPKLFFDSSGDFEDAIVVAMGCQGLATPTMAQALITKGASVYVGWTTWVTADRTDQATSTFLQQHLLDGKSIVEATRITNELIGEDPEYESKLKAIGKQNAML